MQKNLVNHFLVFDNADYPHQPLAFGAGQGIDLIYFLNQSRPIPIGFWIFIRFYDTGDDGILIFFLTMAPGGIPGISEKELPGISLREARVKEGLN